jgi:hypothetical protein
MVSTIIVSGGRLRARWPLVVLLILVLGLPAAVFAAQGPPRSYCSQRSAAFHGRARFFGLMDNQIVSQPAYLDCTLGILARNGIGFYRTPMYWQYIETSRGTYDWGGPDALMTAFARHRMTWLPIVLGAPPFDRVVRVASIVGAYSEPAGTSVFSGFLTAAEQRYGPRGSFWRTHPALPREPIRSWQIWNEPNLPFYWQPAPDPGAYARLLRAAYRTLRRLDKGVTVVSAGIAFSTRGVPAITYYRRMLADGARGAFSALAVHPYAPTVRLAIQRVESVRRLMNADGARRKALFITEYGWASGGPANPYRAASPRAEASMTSAFLSWLVHKRRSLRVLGAAYPMWRDFTPPPGGADTWGYHLGLLNLAGRAKPVYGSVLGAARRVDG